MKIIEKFRRVNFYSLKYRIEITGLPETVPDEKHRKV
jgi:hypothetical protein